MFKIYKIKPVPTGNRGRHAGNLWIQSETMPESTEPSQEGNGGFLLRLPYTRSDAAHIRALEHVSLISTRPGTQGAARTSFIILPVDKRNNNWSSLVNGITFPSFFPR